MQHLQCFPWNYFQAWWYTPGKKQTIRGGWHIGAVCTIMAQQVFCMYLRSNVC